MSRFDFISEFPISIPTDVPENQKANLKIQPIDSFALVNKIDEQEGASRGSISFSIYCYEDSQIQVYEASSESVYTPDSPLSSSSSRIS